MTIDKAFSRILIWLYNCFNKKTKISYPTPSYKLKNWINPEKINWAELSANPNGMELLQEYPDKIDWDGLSSNKSPNAIDLLRDNPDKIDWYLPMQ
jgi:hypothetical protein